MAEGGRRKEPGVGKKPSASPLPPSDARDLTGVVPEVNVIGQRLDDAIEAVEKALDQTLLAGAGRLRVIHGHGTGRLRQGLRAHFRTHGSVETLRAADAREGGDGATILELR